MQDKRIALITGANQGVGFQVAKELVANGLTVLVGSRNFARGACLSMALQLAGWKEKTKSNPGDCARRQTSSRRGATRASR